MAIKHQIKPINALPEEGLIRLKHLLQIIPVGRTSWHEGVKKGIFPQPVRLGPRTIAWRVEDIRALIQANDNEDRAQLAGKDESVWGESR